MRPSTRWMLIVLGVVSLVTLVVWYAASIEDRRGMLAVSFLDVGQGDAIFIDTPSGRQVLIDGGKGNEILRSLSEVMPWYDRSIDLVIATHPDADHIGGLVGVLGRYRVDAVMDSTVHDDGSDARALEAAIVEEGSSRVSAHRGQLVDLGGGVRIEILFPDRAAPALETNTASIVARLVYGETSVLLTGDSPDEIEEYLVALDADRLQSDVLKIGHHGSKTSSSPLFLGYVEPTYGVYSRGCDNSYGHPAAEVTARLAAFGVQVLDTCEEGTITFLSDGEAITRK